MQRGKRGSASPTMACPSCLSQSPISPPSSLSLASLIPVCLRIACIIPFLCDIGLDVVRRMSVISYVGIFGIFIQRVQHALKGTCIYQRIARTSSGSMSPTRIGELELYDWQLEHGYVVGFASTGPNIRNNVCPSENASVK